MSEPVRRTSFTKPEPMYALPLIDSHGIFVLVKRVVYTVGVIAAVGVCVCLGFILGRVTS